MAYIDSYLEHVMEDRSRSIFHFLMQVNSSFDPTQFPGLTISGRLGNIWAASGNKETLEALRDAPGVISVEASFRYL